MPKKTPKYIEEIANTGPRIMAVRFPRALYVKLLGRAYSERRSAHNLALVLIEKGLEAK
jgi:hypothetical protein